MNKTYEIYRDGLMRTIKIKRHNQHTSYETIEFTVHQTLTDENGKTVIDNGYTYFFEPREFKDFFQPIINDLKVKFDNEDSSTQPNT
jgi:hypothetical protein